MTKIDQAKQIKELKAELKKMKKVAIEINQQLNVFKEFVENKNLKHEVMQHCNDVRSNFTPVEKRQFCVGERLVLEFYDEEIKNGFFNII